MQYPAQYGNYTLLESIGEGGMSEIDLAQATVADAQYIRFLVIKRIRDQLVEEESHIRMFQDEARICAELQHANIAQVYDFGRFNEEFFIAMEYIPGVDLRELQKALAKRRKGIPFRITLRILHDVLAALDYAHHRVDTFGQPMNIVHRDVNPRNVMLSVRGEVKLIDFGVAKSTAKQDQTVGHIIKGKFAYMAPEQIEGGAIDGRADLFAMGLMLHEMVEGSRPFHGLSEIQIMHRIISASIPKLTGPSDYPYPELIHEIHQKVLSVDQEDRYLNAKEMQQALIEVSRHCNGMASPQELAQFLSINMPKQTRAISDRLQNYRREVTGSVSKSLATFSASPRDENDFPTINQAAPESTKEKNSSLLTIIMGGLAILAVGVFIFLLSQKQENTELKPTEVKTVKTSKIEKETPKEKQEIKKTKETPKEENIKAEKNTAQNTSSQIVPQKTVSVPQKEEPKEKNTTKVKQEKKEPKETPKEENIKTETIKETPKETPPIKEEKTITVPKITVPKEEKEEIKEAPPAKSVRIFLGVGVASGKKGLPVMIDGKRVTHTGSQKMVSLTIGTHLLVVEDPDTGKKVTKEITIKESQKQQIIQVSGL